MLLFKRNSMFLILFLFIVACQAPLQISETTELSSPQTESPQTLGSLEKIYANTGYQQQWVLQIRTDFDSSQYPLLDKYTMETLAVGGHRYLRLSEIAQQDLWLLASLESSTSVLSLQANAMRQLFTAPNDAYYSSQYAPQDTGLENVWPSYTGKDVKVAVIDSGIATTHADFANNTFIEGWKVDKNTVHLVNEDSDTIGHGTHVAGIIAARKNNGIGISGVAPEAKIIPVNPGIVNGGISSFDIAKAILKAVDLDADIINMSLGGASNSYVEQDAINVALANNITIVAAAGNDTKYIDSYPASFPGVISVAATNGNQEVANFSSRSQHVSIAAPGSHIISLYKPPRTESTYISRSGTSMAAPFVAGVAALIKQKFPNATPLQIKTLLENTAKDIESVGFDTASGHGFIQPEAALAVSSLDSVGYGTFTLTLTNAADGTALDRQAVYILNKSGDTTYFVTQTNDSGTLSVKLTPAEYQFTTRYSSTLTPFTITKNNTTAQTEDLTLPNAYTVRTLDPISASTNTFIYIIDNVSNTIKPTVAASNNITEANNLSSASWLAEVGKQYTIHIFHLNPSANASQNNIYFYLNKGTTSDAVVTTPQTSYTAITNQNSLSLDTYYTTPTASTRENTYTFSPK